MPKSAGKKAATKSAKLRPIVVPAEVAAVVPVVPPPILPDPVPDAPVVLVIQADAATRRAVHEAVAEWTGGRVVSASHLAHGFDLAMRHDFRLFILGWQVGALSGAQFYQLVETARRHLAGQLAPPVIYLGEPPREEAMALREEARVKAILPVPVPLDRLRAAMGAIAG